MAHGLVSSLPIPKSVYHNFTGSINVYDSNYPRTNKKTLDAAYEFTAKNSKADMLLSDGFH